MKVVQFRNGKVGMTAELNFMWLPTFIGQNFNIMRELEKAWASEFAGRVVSSKLLDEIHHWTLDWLCSRFPVEGLSTYLKAIEHVKDDDGIYNEDSERVLLESAQGIDIATRRTEDSNGPRVQD